MAQPIVLTLVIFPDSDPDLVEMAKALLVKAESPVAAEVSAIVSVEEFRSFTATCGTSALLSTRAWNALCRGWKSDAGSQLRLPKLRGLVAFSAPRSRHGPESFLSKEVFIRCMLDEETRAVFNRYKGMGERSLKLLCDFALYLANQDEE